MDSNQAYGIPDRRNHQNTYYYSETYQMIPINRISTARPLPSPTGNLGLSQVSLLPRSESNASYVRMNSVAVDEQEEKCDELYDKVGPKEEEAIYEKVGPSQWSNTYADPSGREMYVNM